MAVYVDDMRAPFGRMLMCHMIADTQDELLLMAMIIGVDRRWIQQGGQNGEHFDVCLSKRRIAVRRGAVLISRLDLGRRILARRTEPERRKHYFSRAKIILVEPDQPDLFTRL